MATPPRGQRAAYVVLALSFLLGACQTDLTSDQQTTRGKPWMTPSRDWSERVFCVDGSSVTSMTWGQCETAGGRGYATREVAELAARQSSSGAAAAPSAPPKPATPARLEVVSTGTGIVINRAGQILTNEHVVQGCARVTVSQPPNPGSVARVLRTSEQEDLALIAAEGSWRFAAVFRSQPTIRPGEAVSVVGFPLMGILSADPSISTGIVNARSGLFGDVRRFQFSAPIQPGNSGGPVLDASGNVVGVATAKLDDATAIKVTGSIPQNVNFAVKGDIARMFLESMGVALEANAKTAPVGLAEMFEAAKAFTVLVQCWGAARA